MISIALTGLIWLVGVLAISKVVERVWAHTIRGKGFRYFVAPGVITHEFSHAGACLVTRTKIHEIVSIAYTVIAAMKYGSMITARTAWMSVEAIRALTNLKSTCPPEIRSGVPINPAQTETGQCGTSVI